MKPELKEFLSLFVPLIREPAVWGSLSLEATYYLADKLPPLDYVTSVRAVVFNDGAVLVVRDGDGNYFVVPGGRREADEAIEATLRREIVEETGWQIVRPAYLGFVHYHHLGPRPAGFTYLYPDFLQLIYVAQAGRFTPAATIDDEYVVESSFMPLQAARQLEMNRSQKMLLEAAVKLSPG